MKFIKRLGYICFIAFYAISCAPATENIAHFHKSEGNFLSLGFANGIALPFAVLGKLMGLNIGLYDAEKNVSYLIGYILALLLYARIIQFIWTQIRLNKKQ